MQGRGGNIFKFEDKICSFQEKCDLWLRKTRNQDFSSFPNLNFCSGKNKFQDSVIDHLKMLKEEFARYFPSQGSIPLKAMVQNPFTVKVDEVSAHLQEVLIDLKNDSVCRDYFEKEDLEKFWVKRAGAHQQLRKEAVKFLTVFSSTYLCEQGFSSLCYVKNKFRNKLQNVEEDLRIALGKIPPRIDLLVDQTQAQGSH